MLTAVTGLYRKGLVYLDVPIADTDYIVGMYRRCLTNSVAVFSFSNSNVISVIVFLTSVVRGCNR